MEGFPCDLTSEVFVMLYMFAPLDKSHRLNYLSFIKFPERNKYNKLILETLIIVT